ncbi:MAG: cell division protein FtsL [Spirochaetes bacterium]|nr:MAG: cell division protein FtsL [Spirochaetota bacterium]RKX80584.1 MAG: cell division protein FtsL [Spirochaetota bacterium]RKX90134.1 MAG: cell division protein FtsL [Spirochaetota bacterium]RKX99049.1 MAG: cell division protein FtsL [Spirochaetota bacterium]
MRRVLVSLALISVPLLMMLQVLQGYRFAVAVEETQVSEAKQLDKLEENKRILAGIAVYDAPERIYQVAEKSLGLREADPESVLLVRFPDNNEAVQ